MHKFAVVLAAVALLSPSAAAAEPHVETNIVYGMYSGLALLMDIYHPERPNGYGVLFVAGSGWETPLGYGAPGLKTTQLDYAKRVAEAGYTVFTTNHRAAPRFVFPAQLEDIQRAVRFIRHNSRQYGIDPDHIGAVAGSSGAQLAGLRECWELPASTMIPIL